MPTPFRILTAHAGRLIESLPGAAPDGGGGTGLPGWDSLAPPGGFRRGAVHELLADSVADASFPMTLLARGMLTDAPIVWVDHDHTLYPPGLKQAGLNLDRLLIVRPVDAERLWTITECLRSAGVSAVVATLPARLTRVDVRRLQLAAEQSGAVGLFFRPPARDLNTYAAATRWHVAPAGGARDTQRWLITLLRGHGGLVGHSFFLERNRAKPIPTCEPFELVSTDRLPDPSRLAGPVQHPPRSA
jgi:hypothetical protein